MDHIWDHMWSWSYMVIICGHPNHIWFTVYDHMWTVYDNRAESYMNIISIYDWPHMTSYLNNHIRSIICIQFICEQAYMNNHVWVIIYESPNDNTWTHAVFIYDCSYMIVHTWLFIYVIPYMNTNMWLLLWYVHIWLCIYDNKYMIVYIWSFTSGYDSVWNWFGTGMSTEITC